MNVAALSLLKDKRILVVGDMIIDHYRILKAKKLSPEAPVLIFEPDTEEFKAGGAGNVVTNLIALGVINTKLATVLGSSGNNIPLLPEQSIAVIEEGRKTTVKERIITRRQQIARIDIQSSQPISSSSAHILFEQIKEDLKIIDAIIFSDYDHGVCIPDLVRPIMDIVKARQIPIIVDSKARDTLSKYKGSTIALPNMDEAKMITKLDEFDDADIARYLMRTMNLKAAAITLGPRGILLTTADKTEIFPPLHENINQEVIDVTGAGDTVAATVAAGLVLNMSFEEIMELANITAGIKVQKRGVATATPEEIMEVIRQKENKNG